ncbi:unnamed protein product [Phaedon cochleariae]|uniref:Uncharacterized protein n=1 Tax=Phaedon cochleariae TaxID=80249 RepID=A0A9N9SJL7_PHACE|nr:unnamed protein product [Phaedon cochleariae]
MSEVKHAVEVMIKQVCEDQTFIKRLVDSVSSGILNILGEKMGQLEKSVDHIKTEIHSMKASHKEEIKNLNDKIEMLEKKVLDTPRNPLDAIQIMEEINEIKSRENNILIFGIPEDIVEPALPIKELITSIIPDSNINTTTIMRLGKKFEGKSRPIRVSLQNKEDVLTLIRNKRRIQSADKFKNVYLRTDQTVKQREYYITLRNELTMRKNNGENNLVIKYKNGHPTIAVKNL